jgi:GTPase SAR1 family protein
MGISFSSDNQGFTISYRNSQRPTGADVPQPFLSLKEGSNISKIIKTLGNVEKISKDSVNEKNTYCDETFRLLVIGSDCCGKTAFIDRYVSGNFLSQHIPTIGCEIATCYIGNVSNCFRLQLYEIVKFPHPMMKTLCQHASGAVLIFSLTDHKSFEVIPKFVENIIDLNG